MTELYRNYIEANGGNLSIAAVHSIILKADYSKVDGQSAKMVLYRKRPNLLRNRILLPNLEINEIYNDGEGWRVVEAAGQPQHIEELSPQQLTHFERESGIEGIFFNLKGRSDYGQVVAIEDVMGAPAYRIAVSPEANQEYRVLWLSMKHYQEVKVSKVVVNETSKEESLHEIYFSDFSTIKDVYFPRKIDNYINGKLDSKLTITSMRMNVGIFNSFFEKPSDL